MANSPPDKPVEILGPVSAPPHANDLDRMHWKPHHLHAESDRETSVRFKPAHEIHTVESGGMDGHIHASSCKCGPSMDGTDMRIWHHKPLA